jgi:hypothetical protein
MVQAVAHPRLGNIQQLAFPLHASAWTPDTPGPLL